MKKLLIVGNCLLFCIDTLNLFISYFGDNQRDLEKMNTA